jgi:hypothetical protein
MADNDNTNNLDRLGRWSLVIGALAFAFFWETALFDVDAPWVIALSIHGVSIATIAFGLIKLEQSSVTGGFPIGWVGTAMAIVGTFASFVLLSVGLTIISISLWIQRGCRAAPAITLIGSVALLLSYLLGARVGTEGARDPSLAAAVLFGGAGFLIPLGLVLIAAKKQPSGVLES